MAAWFGFSDDDLKKVKNMGNSTNEKTQNKLVSPAKKGNLGPAKKLPHTRQTLPSKESNVEVDPSMKLQRPLSKPGNEKGSPRKIPRDNRRHQHVDKEPVEETSSLEKQSEVCNGEASTEDPPGESLDDKEGFDRDMMSLEKFREQQKAIEEANKQKKALLSKTITERKKKAQAEAHKLEHIQRELSKLDHLLTLDVQVIRNKIEDISRDYMEAEKRFQRAEAEYIAAKVDMHEKSEQKEQLTEHMYTIIHQNEVRKARKLAELMREMEMEGGVEEDLHLPELPPLSSFQPNMLPTSPTGLKHIVKHTDTNNSDTKHQSDSDIKESSAETSKSDLCHEKSSEQDKEKTTAAEKPEIIVVQNPSDLDATKSENAKETVSDVTGEADISKGKCESDKTTKGSQEIIKEQIDIVSGVTCGSTGSKEIDKDLPTTDIKDPVNKLRQEIDVPKTKWDFDGNEP